MKPLGRSRKAIFALLLIIAAAAVTVFVYQPEKALYESRKAELEASAELLREALRAAREEQKAQEPLLPSAEELERSLSELYDAFPGQMLEEDQIMYVVSLERIFGEEISFELAEPYTILELHDGAQLQGIELGISYDTDYEGFKAMVEYLTGDSRPTSVKEADIQYDPETDRVSGELSLVCYVLDTGDDGYLRPDIPAPETGKDSIFR